RDLLRSAVAAGVAWSNGSLLATGRYDLLIRGGRVLDPSRKLDRMADVPIAGDRIAAVESHIDPSTAAHVLDATGKLVVPGLVDIHTHARSKEMPSICLSNGVTSPVAAR